MPSLTDQQGRMPSVQVKNLKKYFDIPRKGKLHAVDDVSFDIYPGETLGVVGESGCGKTTVGQVVMRLQNRTDGKLYYHGRDVFAATGNEDLELRKSMQIIFQDPYSSLNPRKTVYSTLSEPFFIHGYKKNAIKEEIERVCNMVDFSRDLLDCYPHELDGGRRQRIGIARALAVEPKFIVCDEPVSALDVSIQAQILNLLKELQQSRGLTFIFITHDLAVVSHFSDTIVVMYLGLEVEKAPAEQLFANPMHPYTKALLSAVLVPEAGANKERITLRGELSSPLDPPDECRFAPRCNYYCEACMKGTPPLVEVESNHFVACHCVAPGRNTLKLHW